jgi:hypothetical protein
MVPEFAPFSSRIDHSQVSGVVSNRTEFLFLLSFSAKALLLKRPAFLTEIPSKNSLKKRG